MLSTREENRFYWQPISLNQLLNGSKLTSWKVILPLVAWGLIIFGCLFVLNAYMPGDWLTGGNKEQITIYFILLPFFVVGLLLLFWVGFEWGFIPVFISAFAVAFNSGMNVGWSILFGFSFIFGLALFGLAYQSLRMPHDLRDLKSISFFISVAFIASLASSLGAFIWSLSHDLTAFNTAIIWKSWWTGIFFQTILITGPLLFLFTPAVETSKQKHYNIEIADEISLKWIYGTVISVTVVLVIFIFSGQWLGKYRVNEVLNQLPNIVRGDVLGALDIFEIIIWLSIGLILVTGFTCMYVIGRWNQELKAKVEERTLQLEASREDLRTSLREKKLMLKETHHRVKNNLAQVQALLRLQMMQVDDKSYRRLIEDSCSRIQSMALIHKALYNTEQYTTIALASYLKNLSKIIHSSFSLNDKEINLQFDLTDYTVNAKQAVPIGLIVTETLINAHKYAFEGKEKGKITISLQPVDNKGTLQLQIADDGVGIPDGALQKSNSLGMKLIQKLTRQLDADLSINSSSNGTAFSLRFTQDAPETEER